LISKAGGASLTVPNNIEEGSDMAWRKPKVVEIACGCEINAYFPADL
jgi:coenzyme PQQ precursor peptide PqqA